MMLRRLSPIEGSFTNALMFCKQLAMKINEDEEAPSNEFNKFFLAHDDNGDGVLSRGEVSRFVRKFLGHPPTAKDLVSEQVGKIWLQYDIDRSGYLSRMETLRFLNDYLASKN